MAIKQPRKSNTNRIDKVNSLIQKVVGETLLPYMQETGTLVTVSKVEASRDLRWAKVWVSIIGTKDTKGDHKILNIIHRNIYDIQGEVNRVLAMKMVPRLQFFLDTSPRYVQHIDELIHKIHEEDEK